MKNKVIICAALALFVAGLRPLTAADVKVAKDQAKTAAKTKAPQQWVPVDEDVWAVFMAAPEYHFALARESMAKKDFRTAAKEIREGTKLLRFQAKKLEGSVAELNALAGKVSTGKAVTGAEMDKVFAAAGKNLDYRQPQIPVVAGENEVFIESSQYHINQAKTKLAAKDQKGAAADIRKAVAYLKLEAAHAGRDLSGDYKSAVDEMETLAKNAESGVDVETAKLEQAFNRAVKDIKKHLR